MSNYVLSRQWREGLARRPKGKSNLSNPYSNKTNLSYLQSKGKDKLLRYDWMQGGSHSVYASYFYLQKTYDWLFSHSLRDKPRQVNRTLNITGEETSNAYTTSWGTQPTNVVREETVPTTTKSTTTTTVKKKKEKREKRTTGMTWRNWRKAQK